MTLALASGATFEGAARLANYAGGVVVMKRGTATVSADELRRAVKSDPIVSGFRRSRVVSAFRRTKGHTRG
jgi:bifunctional ADP-heptose synthase (sugar kinase/adenylyltransferase)